MGLPSRGKPQGTWGDPDAQSESFKTGMAKQVRGLNTQPQLLGSPGKGRAGESRCGLFLLWSKLLGAQGMWFTSSSEPTGLCPLPLSPQDSQLFRWRSMHFFLHLHIKWYFWTIRNYFFLFFTVLVRLWLVRGRLKSWFAKCGLCQLKSEMQL